MALRFAARLPFGRAEGIFFMRTQTLRSGLHNGALLRQGSYEGGVRVPRAPRDTAGPLPFSPRSITFWRIKRLRENLFYGAPLRCAGPSASSGQSGRVF